MSDEDMRDRLLKLMQNFRIVQANMAKTGKQMMGIDQEMSDFLYDLEIHDLLRPSEQTPITEEET